LPGADSYRAGRDKSIRVPPAGRRIDEPAFAKM